MGGTPGRNRFASLAALSIAFLQTTLFTFAAGPVDESALRNAWALYNQQKYAASADAFEKLISSSTPNARLYYYAALAVRSDNRNARAKQLCQYIVTNFPKAAEVANVQKLYPDIAPKAASAPAGLPDAMKGKSVQELMKTEEGRKALQEALEKKDAAAAAAAAKVSPMVAKSKGGRPGDRVFAAADIANDGANGIDQMYYPNCWFESSMSAVAMLPRGQKLMADMIRYGDKEGTYVVRFPGDGNVYTITEQNLEKTGVHDKSLWATLIECAQTLKFPNDAGGQLSEGLAALTGCQARCLEPSTSSEADLSSFIDGAVRSKNPIICGSQGYIGGMPRLVVTGHAYTIVGFDPATSMVTIRNPHGQNAERFSLANDPNHQKFQQLDDGMFKMHISLFKVYFYQVASASL